MIKYNFEVEQPFKDSKNNNKKVYAKQVIEVFEQERLDELNKAKVGRVISAEYIEDTDEVVKSKSKRTRKTTEKNAKKEDETKVDSAENTDENKQENTTDENDSENTEFASKENENVESENNESETSKQAQE